MNESTHEPNLQPVSDLGTTDRIRRNTGKALILTPTTSVSVRNELESQISPNRRPSRRDTRRASNLFGAVKASIDFDDKTKQASFEINRKNPSSRRRVATVEPINLADINSSSSAKKVLSLITETSRGLAKPNKSYRFQCEGTLGGSEEEGSRKVEWKASFERPIEQLIYPSLQRFDHEAFNKRRDLQIQLHGHRSGGLALEASTDSLVLEPLPAADSLVEILPDWAATVTAVLPSDLDPTALSSSSSSVLKDMEVDGEEFLRQKLRSNYAQVRAAQQEAEDALRRLAASEALLNSLPSSTVRLGRKKIIDNAPVLRVVHSHSHPHSAESLYVLLESNREGPGPGPGLGPEPDGASRTQTPPAKLHQLSFEEETLNRHRKLLRTAVAPERDYTMDGLLYYRLQNDIRKKEMERRRMMEQRQMEIAHSKKMFASSGGGGGGGGGGGSIGRKASSTFSSRLDARSGDRRGADLTLTAAEVIAMNSRSLLLVPAAQIDQLPQVPAAGVANAEGRELELELGPDSSARLTRLRRAASTKHVSSVGRAAAGPGPGPGLGPGSPGVLPGSPLSPCASPSRLAGSGSAGLGSPGTLSGRAAARAESARRRHGPRSSSPGATPAEPPGPPSATRLAVDALLLAQLDSGVLPESFIKKSRDGEECVAVDLSNYGIGDTKGLCLSRSLANLTCLESLGLSDNRLTAKALPPLIQGLSGARQRLLHLDLSFNDAHQQGAKALAEFFKAPTVLQYLDCSNCQLQCGDVAAMSRALAAAPNDLQELFLACNRIAADGAAAVCSFVAGRLCRVRVLDLAWNSLGERGASALAAAITLNRTVQRLNVACASLSDLAGQVLAESIGANDRLEEVNCAQNAFRDRTCFVLSRALAGHGSMRKVDLSMNPLGEAGGRALFRTILRGLRCFVVMRGCSYKVAADVFNNSYPSLDSPYRLDLAEPYSGAVLSELLTKVVLDPRHCSIEALTYRDSPKAAELSVPVAVLNGKVVHKLTGEEWLPPRAGCVTVHFEQAVYKPSAADAIRARSFETLQVIVENGRTEEDRRNWMWLLCQDICCTTAQTQQMIDRFQRNRTIGPGGLRILDILKSLWKHLLDTENIFDLLRNNTDVQGRRDLTYALTMKRYKFNWVNPTGSWRLDLADREQREIFCQVMAVNMLEAENSRLHSQRGDTSQMGNWFNFRNSRLTANKETSDVLIGPDFLKTLPATGTIEFDYVSTDRPDPHAARSRPSSAPDPSPDPSLSPAPAAKEIDDDEFFLFMESLGLSARRKLSSTNALFALLDLQLAATKFYFTANRLISLLDAFADEWDIQAKVIVCMFSRVLDLHNMDFILRNLHGKCQHEVVRRLGYLNVMNPLKISFDYVLPLKYVDNRVLLVSLMELANLESPDQIIEDAGTELPIAAMYGAYTRALNETRPETMKFTYGEVGERTLAVSWRDRRELLKKFLVGTHPRDESMYGVVGQYKELAEHGALTRGPVDLQHANFVKSLRSPGPMRSARQGKLVAEAMKEARGAEAAAGTGADATGAGAGGTETAGPGGEGEERNTNTNTNSNTSRGRDNGDLT